MNWIKTTCIVGMLFTANIAPPADADGLKKVDGQQQVDGLKESVSIVFPQDGYAFTQAEVAKGIQLDYTIVVARDVPGVKALPHGPSCAEPAGPSGLYPREAISGNKQLYCLLDFGLAPPCMGEAKLLKSGRYKHSLTWDGRNWTGPSDFNNPKGDPFPAGTYEVTVTVHGEVVTAAGATPYEIKGKTKLVLK